MYKYFFKKETKINWLLFSLSTLSLILMFMSPGNSVRAEEEGVFSSLKIIYINTLYYFTQYAITRHTTMIILLLICCNIYCWKYKSKKSKRIFIINY